MVLGQAAKLKYKLTHANDHELVSSSFITLHLHTACLHAVLAKIFFPFCFSKFSVIPVHGTEKGLFYWYWLLVLCIL